MPALGAAVLALPDPKAGERAAIQVAIRSVLDRATLDSMSPADGDSFVGEVEDLLREEICDSQGNWTAHDARLRFRATKP